QDGSWGWGCISEIDLHPPLHLTEKKKPRYYLDSRVSFVYLGWLMGLTSHSRNRLIFKDFFGGAVDFDGKT
ncbi:MAG: hypothetical protein JSR23_00005, partial [Proteobacteria bacterium]|nr:hypothetical protein [Pseudomonadota bacterium]